MEAVVRKNELYIRLSLIKKANEELAELINICNDEDIDKQKLEERIEERTSKINKWASIVPNCDPNGPEAFVTVECLTFNIVNFDRSQYCK